MSARSVILPLRAVTRSTVPQWKCRRCLATQAESTSTLNEAPLSMPSQSQAQSPQSRLKSLTAEDRTEHTYDPIQHSPRRVDPITGDPYPLTKQDRLLRRTLPHAVPPQYLQHCTTSILPIVEHEQRANIAPHKPIVGVVVSAGKMHKTVKVRVPGQTWNKRIGKYYDSHTNHLVHDPNSSLIEGDVVSLHRLRVSTVVHHVVASIVSPFGSPVESRPPIPSPEDRLAAYKEKRFAKLERQRLRQRAADGDADAIRKLRDMSLDPGKSVAVGAGKAANRQRGVGKKRTPTDGAILGAKGQKLPQGVLPGGKHEVGKIDARAKQNKKKAMKLKKQEAANSKEAAAIPNDAEQIA